MLITDVKMLLLVMKEKENGKDTIGQKGSKRLKKFKENKSGTL